MKTLVLLEFSLWCPRLEKNEIDSVKSLKMEQLKKQRTAAKSCTTRASNTLKDLLADGDDTTAVALEDAAEQFDKLIAEPDQFRQN